DRIVVISEGRFHQVGKPEELYAKPATRFVAEFIGNNNILPGRVVSRGDGRVAVETDRGLRLEALVEGGEFSPGVPVQAAIRPEHIALQAADGADAENTFSIESRQFFGSVVHYLL